MSDQVFVYDYNRIAGRNFQVYYNEQAPTFVVPQTIYNSDGTVAVQGSPQAGLTNQQNWDLYGIAIAGAIVPADATTMIDIHGLVRLF